MSMIIYVDLDLRLFFECQTFTGKKFMLKIHLKLGTDVSALL